MILNPQIGGFSELFCDFGHRPAFQELIAPKWLEIDQDNLHSKFSALNVDFSNPSTDPLGSKRPAYAGVKEGSPCHLSAVGLSSVKMVADKHRHAA